MKRSKTVDVRVEGVDLWTGSHSLTLSLWLQRRNGRYLRDDIAIHFLRGAPKHSTLYRNWTLVEHLLRCQNLNPDEAYSVRYWCLMLRCFKLRLCGVSAYWTDRVIFR